ncbi:hypothetical protein BDI4_580048 [Burkholderia diffusa]|nr:hypothetical protein BDI4_580048 [Burkholderia diffusa]
MHFRPLARLLIQVYDRPATIKIIKRSISLTLHDSSNFRINVVRPTGCDEPILFRAIFPLTIIKN